MLTRLHFHRREFHSNVRKSALCVLGKESSINLFKVFRVYALICFREHFKEIGKASTGGGGKLHRVGKVSVV